MGIANRGPQSKTSHKNLALLESTGRPFLGCGDQSCICNTLLVAESGAKKHLKAFEGGDII